MRAESCDVSGAWHRRVCDGRLDPYRVTPCMLFALLKCCPAYTSDETAFTCER